MSKSLGVAGDPLIGSIKSAIAQALPKAEINVSGGGGHFRVSVISSEFEGKNMLQRHRLVMSSLKELMAGDSAPVHAIDQLETLTPG